MRGAGTSLAPVSLLDLLEPGWSQRLRGCALVCEADPEPDLVLAAARALGREGARTDLARRWPACVVMALVGTLGGVAEADAASRWASWWRACGQPRPTGADADRWSAVAREALAALGLSVFPDLDPLGALLRHTGTESAPIVAEPAATLALEPFGRGLVHGIGTRIGSIGEGWRAVASPGAAELRTARFPLAFDEDGTLQPESEPLPREPMWLLYPVEAGTLRADVPLRIVAHGRMPLGWPGWHLLQVSLEGVSWLELDSGAGDSGAGGSGTGDRVARDGGAGDSGAGGSGTARNRGARNRGAGDRGAGGVGGVNGRRPVRGWTKPRLLLGEPVPGLATERGGPVYAQPPGLRLPHGAEQWRVEIRRPGASVLVGHTLTGDDAASADLSALWRGVPRPLLGEYSVRVRGAAGPGLQQTVALAEGLAPVCRPAVRLLLDSGLEPAEALLETAPGMTASPSALAFDQLTVGRSIGLVVREHSWHVVVTPPRLRVALDGGESTDGHPLCLSQGQLAGAGPLRIELPGARRAPDLELVAEGRTVQTLRPYRDGGYNLRRLLDTAAEHPGAELRIRHEGRSGLVAAIERAVVDDPWLPPLTNQAANPGR